MYLQIVFFSVQALKCFWETVTVVVDMSDHHEKY